MIMMIMQKTEGSCYHKGHYTNTDVGVQKSLIAIKNPDWNFNDEENDEPGFAYEDADVFWMGACNLFSLAVNRELGYCAYEIRGRDNRLIHSFCLSEYKGQKAMIDVRGVTTDIQEFWTRFCVFPGEQVRIQKQDTESDYVMLTEDEQFGFRFATRVLNQNRDYYQIDCQAIL